MEDIMNHYPDIVSSFAIPTILGVIAMMIPLLLSNGILISNKYKSQHIIRLFMRESVSIGFAIVFFTSIIALILWLLQIPRCIDFGCMNVFVDNSALIILLISAILLLIMALGVIVLLFIYLKPKFLFNKISKRYKRWQSRFERNHSKRLQKRKDFMEEIILEMMIYSIRAELPYIYDNFLIYYYENCLRNVGNGFSEDNYRVIEKAIYAVCKTQKDKFVDFEINNWFWILLKKRNDERTRQSIWKCVRCCIVSKNDRFLKDYLNEANSIDNNEYSEEFRAFNCMIGAMLLYSGNYTMVKKLLSNDYGSLTAVSISCVIPLYGNIRKMGKYKIVQNYPFPDINNDGNAFDDIADDYGDLNIEWIDNFFALLFLKNFRYESCQIPASTKSSDVLDNLLKKVLEYNKNKDLLKKLNIAIDINDCDIEKEIDYFEQKLAASKNYIP